MAGVQNILDVVDLVEVLAADIVAARADGSIGWFDVPKFADVIPALNKALDGANQIVDEVKDLDGDEIKVVLKRLITALNALGKACLGAEIPAALSVVLEKGLDLVSMIFQAWVAKK
jgi:hypothetical protein